MNVYTHDIPLAEAKSRLKQALKAVDMWQVLGTEEIPLNEDALGRVLTKPVWAKISSPHYHASAMDGYAVRSEDTEGALQTSPVVLDMGTQAVYVDTGDPIPGWANAVIMIEHIEPIDSVGSLTEDVRQPEAIRIRAAVPPWKHVRSMGEDMVATQLVLPAGHELRPVDLGAIAGCGHSLVVVARKPLVAIIPSGTELKPIGETVSPGDIIEYNSMVLAAQVNSWGGVGERWKIVPDVYEDILTQVLKAAQNADLILLNAGSSAGSEDYSAQVVETLGKLLVHGVAVRPGHPVILGMVDVKRPAGSKLRSSIPIIGVPGYPVSTTLTSEIFVEPLMATWLGRRPWQPLEMKASLTRKITSPAGDDDYVRMAVGMVGDRTVAAPLSRGSGVITSLVRADGIVVIPSGSQGLTAGEEVNVRLYRSPGEIENTIFAIGSHDMTLDIMAQYLAKKGRRLVSANVGSLGGLIAIRRGEAHLGGSHLLDPENGEYNLSYIRQYLPGVPIRVLALVGRDQGLIVPKGNPKEILSIQDLASKDISYVNRQRGAGTRVLFDYHCEKTGIEPHMIRGYEQEEYTHLAVAAAIASGRADCGMGIAAAAQALDLAFVPLFQERYDLVIPQVYADGNLLAPLLDILQDGDFNRVVSELPGYEVARMGEVISELE